MMISIVILCLMFLMFILCVYLVKVFKRLWYKLIIYLVAMIVVFIQNGYGFVLLCYLIVPGMDDAAIIQPEIVGLALVSDSLEFNPLLILIDEVEVQEAFRDFMNIMITDVETLQEMHDRQRIERLEFVRQEAMRFGNNTEPGIAEGSVISFLSRRDMLYDLHQREMFDVTARVGVPVVDNENLYLENFNFNFLNVLIAEVETVEEVRLRHHMERDNFVNENQYDMYNEDPDLLEIYQQRRELMLNRHHHELAEAILRMPADYVIDSGIIADMNRMTVSDSMFSDEDDIPELIDTSIYRHCYVCDGYAVVRVNSGQWLCADCYDTGFNSDDEFQMNDEVEGGIGSYNHVNRLEIFTGTQLDELDRYTISLAATVVRNRSHDGMSRVMDALVTLDDNYDLDTEIDLDNHFVAVLQEDEYEMEVSNRVSRDIAVDGTRLGYCGCNYLDRSIGYLCTRCVILRNGMQLLPDTNARALGEQSLEQIRARQEILARDEVLPMVINLPDEAWDDHNRQNGLDDHGDAVVNGPYILWAECGRLGLQPVECVICGDIEDLLACDSFHQVCRSCILSWEQQSYGTCPICRVHIRLH